MPSDVGQIYVDQPYNCRTVQCSHAWTRAHVHLPLAFNSVCDVGQCVRIPHTARGVGVGGGFEGDQPNVLTCNGHAAVSLPDGYRGVTVTTVFSFLLLILSMTSMYMSFMHVFGV